MLLDNYSILVGLYEYIHTIGRRSEDLLETMSILSLQAVTRRFGDFVAVKELSFTIGSGQIVGFLVSPWPWPSTSWPGT
jgi:hypothetical protein